MGKFSVIAGSGHCGTMWLSRVLDAGTDTTWYHERRRALAGPWPETLRLGPEHEHYAGYWQAIRAALQVGDVGDANSWLPTLLPQVNRIVPIDRVIYLTRNPIQQLHSLTSRSYVWSNCTDGIPDAFNTFMLQLRGITSSTFLRGPWEQWTPWDKMCLLVKANRFMPDWLRYNGLTVDVYSLEELTTDTNLLFHLAPRLTWDETQRWQRRDVNRKVYGDRTPEAIWDKWTDEQRKGFVNIVGERYAREWEREGV